jgi:ribosomal protein L32
MTIWPKKKISKSDSRTRTTNWIKLTAKKIKNKVMLNKEGNGLSHFIDENWMYKNRQVLKIKTKSKKVSRI